MHPNLPVIFDEASFLKRFMKKLTRDRVVPIISANTSWLILGTTVSGLLSLPNCASSNRILASAFAGIEELIDQVRLDASFAPEKRGEHLGQF